MLNSPLDVHRSQMLIAGERPPMFQSQKRKNRRKIFIMMELEIRKENSMLTDKIWRGCHQKRESWYQKRWKGQWRSFGRKMRTSLMFEVVLLNYMFQSSFFLNFMIFTPSISITSLFEPLELFDLNSILPCFKMKKPILITDVPQNIQSKKINPSFQ